MTPETKFEQIKGVLIAMLLTVLVLPILGLWAVASGIKKLMRRKCPRT